MSLVNSSAGGVLEPILERYSRNPRHLMQILRETQERLDFIPKWAVDYLAEALALARTQVQAVIDFYAFFYDSPRGKYRILFSDNVTDRMQGNTALLSRMLSRLGLTQGQVSGDGLVSIDTTSCTGMCDQGPALLVNNYPVTRLSSQRIDQICELVKSQTPLVEWPSEFFHVEDNIHRKDVLLSTEMVNGQALKHAIELGPQGMLAEMKASNFRGRGGAGFTTGVKWEACRNAPGQTRYVICNADEGEPGTFKDRVLLASFAERVFEGMTIAGYVIGASKGLVYLRAEYRYMLEKLQAKLEARRKTKLLGKDILGQKGFDFDIEIHMGAGAYVCGEETALIESLEGKPGRPRIRPPFPVTHGYLGQPTVVNNVETLAKATLIAQNGGAWYKGLGTKLSTGTKLLSISGDCNSPGIYEYPFGVRITQILEDCGARNAMAVQVGGAAGTCLARHEFGRKIAFEDVSTSGALMVFGDNRDMFEVARNFMHFFKHESCGFCTPCRVGTTLMCNLMDKIANGKGTGYEMNELSRLHQLLKTASHCGLGQSAGRPIYDTLQKFRPSYDRRLKQKDFEPAFDLDASLAPAREIMDRDDMDAHLGTDL
ncbi:MAG: NAD(P)H-dependent oxidoreductase subunit E [Proteobacteria bacterium]|nr:NAD(P)H-dependent oxidoreductase subunit E [Cystobacterineae bacterium]MCL2259492.1 NAD(P)H-dependent oxidoreductase subunit E [Cystobacterineae bacterium]MCL2314098.1 NAD(P)H-dependent oxidoreductase subunit E [Pseudomonadota bacterium]